MLESAEICIFEHSRRWQCERLPRTWKHTTQSPLQHDASIGVSALFAINLVSYIHKLFACVSRSMYPMYTDRKKHIGCLTGIPQMFVHTTILCIIIYIYIKSNSSLLLHLKDVVLWHANKEAFVVFGLFHKIMIDHYPTNICSCVVVYHRHSYYYY